MATCQWLLVRGYLSKAMLLVNVRVKAATCQAYFSMTASRLLVQVKVDACKGYLSKATCSWQCCLFSLSKARCYLSSLSKVGLSEVRQLVQLLQCKVLLAQADAAWTSQGYLGKARLLVNLNTYPWLLVQVKATCQVTAACQRKGCLSQQRLLVKAKAACPTCLTCPRQDS